MKRYVHIVVLVLVACAVLDLTLTRAESTPLLRPVPIVDANAGLLSFRNALSRTASRSGVTRVLYIGDSAVVGDGLTGVLRRVLQLRYGDAGAGFLAVGRPWPWYRHHDVKHGGEGWEYEGVHNRLTAKERMFGLGFLRGVAQGRRASAYFGTEDDTPVGRHVGRFELFYLEQPGGGELSVSVDGALARTLSTDAAQRGPGYFELDVPDGAHRLELETSSGRAVRVFGVVMERKRPGVVLDAIGVNGAHATHMLANDPELLRAHLERRDPNLIIVQLGTNLKTRMPTAKYADEMRSFVSLLRKARPGASCLLITPFDRTTVPPSDEEPTPDYIPKVARALEGVARDTGCAYYSFFDAMGGEGSFRRFQRLGLAQYDGMHLTRDGYEVLADALTHELLKGAP